MILYCSGTGNTRYVAQSLAQILGDEATDIRIYHKTGVTEELSRHLALSESIGFVFPVYSWGPAPEMVRLVKTLSDTALRGKYVWAVCVCGDETGLTHRMFAKVVRSRGGNLDAVFSVIMPNNYVLLPGFGIDSNEVEQQKLQQAPERLRFIADAVKNHDMAVDVHCGPWPRLKSYLVYPLFKRWGVSPKKWHYTDDCISCGKCAQVCPTGNIEMTPDKDGKLRPVWGKDCLSCCACFHYCPVNAVQYGNITRKMGQYFNKEKS